MIPVREYDSGLGKVIPVREMIPPMGGWVVAGINEEDRMSRNQAIKLIDRYFGSALAKMAV
jgi:hypothetical protein